MFDLAVPLGEKILRPVIVYLFLVVVLRVIGKRELGQANTFDLVVIVLVANAVQNGIIGDDVTVTGAIVGAVTLFAVNEAFSRAAALSPRFSRLVEGDPVLLVRDGKPIRRALRRTGISASELRALARRQGFEQLAEVGTAILETNGVVSMFRAGEPPVARHGVVL